MTLVPSPQPTSEVSQAALVQPVLLLSKTLVQILVAVPVGNGLKKSRDTEDTEGSIVSD